MSFLYEDEELASNQFSSNVCHSQPCHYLKLSTVAEDGELSADQAIPWLTSGTTLTDDTATTESRTLFFTGYKLSDVEVGLPISTTDLNTLIHTYHFPARFFMTEIRFGRIADHYITSVGPCWFMREKHFAAVTLLREEERVYQTIVIGHAQSQTHILEQVRERCKKLESFWQQPLLPMVVLLDLSLAKHRRWSNSLLAACENLYHSLELPQNDAYSAYPEAYSSYRPRVRDEELSELLTKLTSRRHETIPSIGNLRSLVLAIKVMDDVARSHGWDWISTFKYFTVSAKDILEKFVEADARFDAYIRTVQIKVAQRDTEINQKLARSSAETAIASKRDSSSMKIIAVLTTLFLPSAFVAAILSTPEYSDWPAGVTWRFWAISTPLTVVIMVGLLTWLTYDNKQTRLLRSEVNDGTTLESSRLSHWRWRMRRLWNDLKRFPRKKSTESEMEEIFDEIVGRRR